MMFMYVVGVLQAPSVSLPVRHNQRTSDVEHATMTVAPSSGGQLFLLLSAIPM